MSPMNNALVLKRYRYIKQGENLRVLAIRKPGLLYNYKDLSKCHEWIYLRLYWDKPSVVISNYRKNMLIHPEQDRGLSVREAARLQSFPDQLHILRAYRFPTAAGGECGSATIGKVPC